MAVALAVIAGVAPETITQVANALDSHACVAPFHAGQRGHPIGFGADFFAGLTSLDGDEGARRLIDPTKLVRIESDDAGILRDVDTPADLAP